MPSAQCSNPSCDKEETKTSDAFSKCSRCKVVRYCCRECQAMHWKGGVGPSGRWGHKLECEEVKKQKAKPKIEVNVVLDEPSTATDTQNIRIVARFGARPIDIFRALTDEGMISAYTRSEARMNAKVNGLFSFFGGSIVGKVLELEEGRRVVWRWARPDWGRTVHSNVNIELEQGDSDGETLVTLRHTGIPKTDKFENVGSVMSTLDGWKERMFIPMKQILGYSYELETAEIEGENNE